MIENYHLNQQLTDLHVFSGDHLERQNHLLISCVALALAIGAKLHHGGGHGLDVMTQHQGNAPVDKGQFTLLHRPVTHQHDPALRLFAQRAHHALMPPHGA